MNKKMGTLLYVIILLFACPIWATALLCAKVHDLLGTIGYSILAFIMFIAALMAGTWYQVSEKEK